MHTVLDLSVHTVPGSSVQTVLDPSVLSAPVSSVAEDLNDTGEDVIDSAPISSEIIIGMINDEKFDYYVVKVFFYELSNVLFCTF